MTKISGTGAGSGSGSADPYVRGTDPQIRIRKVPKCNGSATLVKTRQLGYECRVPDVEGNILNGEDEAGVLSGVQQAAAHRQLP